MQEMTEAHSSVIAEKDLQIKSLQSDLDAANQQAADEKQSAQTQI